MIPAEKLDSLTVELNSEAKYDPEFRGWFPPVLEREPALELIAEIRRLQAAVGIAREGLELECFCSTQSSCHACDTVTRIDEVLR